MFGTGVDEVMSTRRTESRRGEEMESRMRISTKRFIPTERAEIVALNWESLGQLVRCHTLDAVAMHFADTGLRESCAARRSRGLKPAAQERVDVIHE